MHISIRKPPRQEGKRPSVSGFLYEPAEILQTCRLLLGAGFSWVVSFLILLSL